MNSKMFATAQDAVATGTASVEFSTQLISGTAVQVAGVGLDRTVSPFLATSITLSVRPPDVLKLGDFSRPSVLPAQRSRRRKKFGVRGLERSDILAALGDTPDEATVSAPSLKIRRSSMGDSQRSPVRLVGKEGSASPPTKKSYDVDLDEYQFE